MTNDADDSATDRVLGSLDPDVADLFRGYLSEPLVSIDILEDQVALYAKQLDSLSEDGGEFDLEFAMTLAAQCEGLLAGVDEDDVENRELVQAAVRYFCCSEDADGDIDSLIGFDDDASVIEAVAIAVGMEDVLDA